MTQASTLDISKTIKEVLEPHGEFVFLLGSADTERFRDNSDIDIAVYWKPNVTEKQMSECLRYLEEKFGRDVDLVSLNDIDVIFARQVLETGRLQFCHSPGVLLNWKMNTLSAYPDFKASRKVIEDHILNRKKYV